MEFEFSVKTTKNAKGGVDCELRNKDNNPKGFYVKVKRDTAAEALAFAFECLEIVTAYENSQE